MGTNLFENELFSSGIELIKNDNLSKYTTFRIGGNSLYTIFPIDDSQLIFVIKKCKEYGIKFYVIGNGSNLLIDDNGYDGAIIATLKMNSIKISKNIVTCGAGVKMPTFCKFLCKNGLSGAEFLYGIPSSIGGAIFMNCGAYGHEIKEICYSIKSVNTDTLEIKEYDNFESDFFAYRTSYFSKCKNEIIVSASFILSSDIEENINLRMQNLIEKRKASQPTEYPSAGSIFKNGDGYYSSQIIDKLGLKGTRFGDAEISKKHAGFIINMGKATASDVKKLIEFTKEKVYKETGIKIETEVIYLR